MSDNDPDLHEPEHDHLLDREFDDDYDPGEAEADPMFDDIEDEAEYGLDVLDEEDHEDW